VPLRPGGQILYVANQRLYDPWVTGQVRLAASLRAFLLKNPPIRSKGHRVIDFLNKYLDRKFTIPTLSAFADHQARAKRVGAPGRHLSSARIQIWTPLAILHQATRCKSRISTEPLGQSFGAAYCILQQSSLRLRAEQPYDLLQFVLLRRAIDAQVLLGHR
jgi:hypothetical protein